MTMAKRKRSARSDCPCTHTSGLPFSSTLLFLSIILPSTSYAQVVSQPPTNPNPNPTPAPTPSDPLRSTLLTTTPSSTNPAVPSLVIPPPPPDDDNGDSQVSSQGAHVFKYYFLIIAVVAIIFVLAVLYFGRRRKRKAEILRTNSQRALAQDVAGFHERFGAGAAPSRFVDRRFGAATRGFGRSSGGTSRGGNPFPFQLWGMRGGRTEEGLDERGEAPPPYGVGTKPPSLRSVTIEAVELTNVNTNENGNGNGNGNETGTGTVTVNTTVNVNGNEGTTTTEVAGRGEPPGYDEHPSPPTNTPREVDLGDLNLTRPTPSVPPPAAVVTRPENTVVVEEGTSRTPGTSSAIV
ncbi:hypothetical protein HYFRA_00003389 [Hymenoscyphus fraxineus]|uniref:Transmembrane protein n=1 Tax=Hymenoscyphus fraxineus TaxID=746836 RepID=A0A9N9KV50_9HELO|nr:hypothetical protein HYFRA_00003389 [Hymenoscyphus fraxineus]